MVVRESLVSKVFKHFGETRFRQGAFKFSYTGTLYDIHSVDETRMFYGDLGWSLKTNDQSQFIVTKVETRNKLSGSCCIIHIEHLP